MATPEKQKIDRDKLLHLLNSIGYTIEQAERDYGADFSDTVAYDIKKALWDDIKLARFYRQIFPDIKMQSVRIDPGTGGGG